MVWETKVQSQVESYQRLKKWYLIPPCLTLSIIRYGSRVKWSKPKNGVVPSPTLSCCSYWKWSLWVTLDYGHQLYLSPNNLLHKILFPLLSKELWSRMNGCYSILFSNLKQKKNTLLLVELFVVTLVPCILGHPI